uniref:MYND-type domain-containing protein n=1 Tax=Grammatophora oceanica TaxID=210454 RepID=A0A7S1Y499_9STRA
MSVAVEFLDLNDNDNPNEAADEEVPASAIQRVLLPMGVLNLAEEDELFFARLDHFLIFPKLIPMVKNHKHRCLSCSKPAAHIVRSRVLMLDPSMPPTIHYDNCQPVCTLWSSCHQAGVEELAALEGDFGGIKGGLRCANCKKYGLILPTCSQCGVTPYCSKKCQQQHWKKEHKEECKTLLLTKQNSSLLDDDE